MVMNGYYGRDSSESFDEDGWLKTGDVVYYDEENFFYIVDRIKEMLKYKSWHVPPAMVEKVNSSIIITIFLSVFGFIPDHTVDKSSSRLHS